MKYIKTYEQSFEPYIYNNGEFLVCEDSEHANNGLDKFLSNHIGNYIDFNPRYNSHKVIYHNIPNDLIHFFNGFNYRYFGFEEILFHSKYKKECKVYLDAKKYNL